MRETQNCRALKSQILRRGAGNPSKILPPNSLKTQFVPTVQNVASDLNKTRNQLSVNTTDRETNNTYKYSTELLEAIEELNNTHLFGDSVETLNLPMIIMNGLEVVVSQLLESNQNWLVEHVVSRFVFGNIYMPDRQ